MSKKFLFPGLLCLAGVLLFACTATSSGEPEAKQMPTNPEYEAYIEQGEKADEPISEHGHGGLAPSRRLPEVHTPENEEAVEVYNERGKTMKKQ